jgi:hypothetical protein
VLRRFYMPVTVFSAEFSHFATAGCAALVILNFFVATTGRSESSGSTNSREICRKSVSSALGNLMGDSAMADDSVTLAERYKKKSRALIDSEELKIKTLNKKLASTDYTPDLIAQKNLIATSIKLYHGQLQESENQLEDAKKLQVTTKKNLASLRKKIEAIFIIVMSDDPEGATRQIFNTVTWKSACPKYRVLCPLPEADALALVSITDDIDDHDQACIHYSKLK